MALERDEAQVTRDLERLSSASYSACCSYATPDEMLAAYEQGFLEALDRMETKARAVREVEEIAARYASRRQAA